MICERLLKQQEVRLRYEYETVLNQRLDGKKLFFSLMHFNESHFPDEKFRICVALVPVLKPRLLGFILLSFATLVHQYLF